MCLDYDISQDEHLTPPGSSSRPRPAKDLKIPWRQQYCFPYCSILRFCGKIAAAASYFGWHLGILALIFMKLGGLREDMGLE